MSLFIRSRTGFATITITAIINCLFWIFISDLFYGNTSNFSLSFQLHSIPTSRLFHSMHQIPVGSASCLFLSFDPMKQQQQQELSRRLHLSLETEDDNVDDEDTNIYSKSFDNTQGISSTATTTMLFNNSIHLAPASEIAYFYLQNTIGLSDETMWKITNEAGSVLGFTVANLERKIAFLRRMMNLSHADVQIILSKQPSLLHMSPNRNIAPTILFLVRALDFSKEDLRTMILAYPAILCYSIPNLRDKIQFFFQHVQWDSRQIRSVLVALPKLLCSSVSTGLLPRFQFLLEELNIPLQDIQYILQRYPKLLLCSVEQNLKPKFISFFIMRLQFRTHHIVTFLKSYPQMMDYSLDNHLLPIAKYFLLELEFSPMELRRILLKFPKLMSYSLVKIKYVTRFLRYSLGMDANQVKRVLFQAPQVVSINTDVTFVGKVDFLSSFLGLYQDHPNEEEEYASQGKDNNEKNMENKMNESKQTPYSLDKNNMIRKILVGMPTILLCSIEMNLKPKLNYLLQEVNGDVSELRDMILTLPTLLGYSLEKRIQPRMEKIKKMNAGPPRMITVAITMTEIKFDQWLSNRCNNIKKKEEENLDSITVRKNKKERLALDTALLIGTSSLSSGIIETTTSGTEKRVQTPTMEQENQVHIKNGRNHHENNNVQKSKNIYTSSDRSSSVKMDESDTEKLIQEGRIIHWPRGKSNQNQSHVHENE